MTARPIETRVRDVRGEPPADWDARTVDPPGGHVLQGGAWAAHRSAQGWTPRFVTFDDDRAALVLTHPQPPLPGFVAYAPRGPIGAGDAPERVAARAVGLAEWLRGQGATILAVDPELDADPAYDAALARAGFHPTEELQPSRHRMVLPLPAGDGPDEVLARISKGTRQRIRAAEEAGTTVVDDVAGEHLEAFGRLVDATAERKRFGFATDRGFLDWWRRVVLGGRGRFWVALTATTACSAGCWPTARQAISRQRSRPTGPTCAASCRARCTCSAGTLSARRSTAAARRSTWAAWTSGEPVAGPRRATPATGCTSTRRRSGRPGSSPTAAHEIVLRPWVYRAGLAARRARRLVRGRS